MLVTEFEVGKWYKRNNFESRPSYLAYIKHLGFKSRTNGQEYLERINGDGEYIKYLKPNWCNNKGFTLLEDLLEIEQFLPIGHPDSQLNQIYECW